MDVNVKLDGRECEAG